MIPHRLPGPSDPPLTVEQACDLQERWGLDYRLIVKLQQMSRRLEFPVSIISGTRTREHQERLAAEGRPAAAFALSTHASEDVNGCPRFATGADVRVGIAVVPAVQARLGAEAVFAGLRWGGGSPVDPETGIPSDWNHLDLGPRSQFP